ncbi:HigA family addiction module antitoxin [Rhodomicrobium udaipurense]|uniref:HigA family addiction module antitoxin n=1 Tax=Rhodomicrobium udaipurense TaxID=1202716 RepID=UPI000AB44135|nr:HigA family addiction module antitoxin [Rhodomicrobium udaipurense]
MVDEAKQGLPFRPHHPGEVLREDILPALGMTVKELAEHLGVTRQTLSGLLHERRAASVTWRSASGKRSGTALASGSP